MRSVIAPLVFLLGIGTGGEVAGSEKWEFSHYQHVKVEELECSDCHNRTMRTMRLEDIRPGVPARTCLECHDGDKGFEQTRPLLLLDSSFRVPRKAEEGSLKFSHRAHVNAKVDCSTCHGDVLEDGMRPTTREARLALQRLSMRSCMECHVQEKTADMSCLTCHDKMRAPRDHMSAFWIRSKGHGLQANLKAQDCAMCHDQGAHQPGDWNGKLGDCADCHMGTDSRKVHGANYRHTHGTDVKFKKMDCATCHQPLNQFCGDCHEGTGRFLR